MGQISVGGNFSTLEEKVSLAIVEDRSVLRKVTDIYFKPKFFEKSGKLYETLGVKYVQKAIMGTAGRVLRAIGIDKISGNYFIGKKRDLESLKSYENGTRINELIHTPLTIILANNTINSLAEENYGNAAVTGVIGLVNAGCTMLQRYNRARVDKVIERSKRKQF